MREGRTAAGDLPEEQGGGGDLPGGEAAAGWRGKAAAGENGSGAEGEGKGLGDLGWYWGSGSGQSGSECGAGGDVRGEGNLVGAAGFRSAEA